MRKLRFAVFVIGLIGVLRIAGWAQGCSGCRTALESSPEGKVMAASFAQGILMLMFLPYIIVAAIAIGVYCAYRRKLKESDSKPA